MVGPSEAVPAVVPVWAAQGDALIEAVAAWGSHVAAGRIGAPARALDAAGRVQGAVGARMPRGRDVTSVIVGARPSG